MTLLAKDLHHHLSTEAKARKVSILKGTFKHLGTPGLISLGGGLPLPSLFPFSKLTVEGLAPPFAHGIDFSKLGQAGREDELKLDIFKSPSDLDKQAGKDGHAGIVLDQALQYNSSTCLAPLHDFIVEHTRLIHAPKYEDWDIIVTNGNAHSWDTTLRLFADRGDCVLTEQFTFSAAADAAHALGVQFVPVPSDLQGVVPEKLEELLSGWEATHGKNGKKLPGVFYTIPTGQNPMGGTLPAERRKRVYEIMSKYDILIVEDEPYYFLQMDEYKRNHTHHADLPAVPTHSEFIGELVPSYLSLDTEGRVIRLDCFSKVLAPGVRIGWVVAQKRFIERYERVFEISIQMASGLAQAVVYRVLNEWGQDGYLDWLIQVRREYTLKRNVAVDAISKYIPSTDAAGNEITAWIAPEAGMFFWIRVDASQHPKYNSVEAGQDPSKVELAVYEKGLERSVMMIPGHWFIVEGENEVRKGNKYMYFRGTFASATADVLSEGIKRFGDVLKAEYGLE